METQNVFLMKVGIDWRYAYYENGELFVNEIMQRFQDYIKLWLRTKVSLDRVQEFQLLGVIPLLLYSVFSPYGVKMLEGNISALLSSTLSKVFEEKCLTKDNIESDIYNGTFLFVYII